MKPIIQKILLQENESFTIQTQSTFYFEVSWHQHIECELILFTEGSGTAFIGSKAVSFKTGEVFFIGTNLPHRFQKNEGSIICATLVHFRDDCFGYQFMNMPECRAMKQLLQMASYGLQVTGQCKHLAESFIKAIETTTGGNRLVSLLQCLHVMTTTNEYVTLCPPYEMEYNHGTREWIEKVILFTEAHFQDPISLSQVAAIACMSVPSFCQHFKRCNQKTYIDFLNEVRINYACRQLQQTSKKVTDIGYESGYNSIAHFHEQFLRFKKQTPLQYRKSLSCREWEVPKTEFTSGPLRDNWSHI